MFFVNLTTEVSNHSKAVLKVYKKEEMKSFEKEIDVFKRVQIFKETRRPSDEEIGFPDMLSYKYNTNTGEILMEALGPNLKVLLNQCQKNVFSKTTIFMITI